MDYQQFIQQLPRYYQVLEQGTLQPISADIQSLAEHIPGQVSPNFLQFLNAAVTWLEPGDVYCQIGCSQDATLIGALLNQPEKMAYAVDNFAGLNEDLAFNQLLQQLSRFQLDEQIFVCSQTVDEFFINLRDLDTSDRIGLYVYQGNADYRSQLLALLLVRPFLADRALMILDYADQPAAKQAHWDFMATHPQCQRLVDSARLPAVFTSIWQGFQVLQWDVNCTTNYSWQTLQTHHQTTVIQALNALSIPTPSTEAVTLTQLYNHAKQLQQAGQWLEAEQALRQLLQINPNQVDALYDLATTLYRLERYSDAIEVLIRVIDLCPAHATYHYSLGVILAQIGDFAKAGIAYQEAIAIDPHCIDAYNALGQLVADHGDRNQAEQIYRQAITHNPTHTGLHLNFGNLLLSQQKIDAAITAYQTALELNPNDADTLTNLEFAQTLRHDSRQANRYFANECYQRKDYQQAAIYYQNLLDLQVDDLDVYIALASCYQSLRHYEAAIKTYQAAIHRYPDQLRLYCSLIMILQESGYTDAAIATVEQALELFPDSLILKLLNYRILPIIYQTQVEIETYRQRFLQGLDEFIQSASLALGNPQLILNSLHLSTNFYLHYQGKNDLAIQQKYGQFLHQVMARVYPDWVEPLPMPPLTSAGKIRIGYLSSAMGPRRLGELTLGWLRYCDRQRFEIYSYSIDAQVDQLTQEFRAYSDVFHLLSGSLEALCQQVLADQLHLLVFTDIGLDPRMTEVASLRLAPIQCTTWSHPVTTGLPTIDYFLSSERMEPEDAISHYSETVIPLPNIAMSFAQPVLPTVQKTRADFQLGDHRTLYLCCQALFKYLPQHDFIFTEIARQVPTAQFAFIAHPSPQVTQQFHQRLKRTFSEVQLDVDDYCVILPRLHEADYLNLNQVADIFLDTFDWSGGITTLKAIACNLPVVTCPGAFMRGRHSSAILQTIGMHATIAADAAEYIAIAVRLGVDNQWRQQIIQQIKLSQSSLFEDRTCVTALETFVQQIVSEVP